MKLLRISIVLAGVALAAFALPAEAQDRSGVNFTLGLGARVAPDYFGAGTTRVGPTGAISVQKLVLPGGLTFGSANALPTDPGFGPRGSFRMVSSRKSGDHKDLGGMDDIDHAFELGAGLVYVTEHGRAFADVRKGFGGHEGWVAEVGIDAVLRPNQWLVLSGGPRANWGDTDFLGTYFGVTSVEAARSSYEQFTPDGGLVSLGFELSARYDFQNHWALHGVIGYERLQEDASRSPITQRGDRDQFSVELILTRSFSLGY